MEQLEGRGAVVTGGGSGIGEGLALACARAGMDVAVADIELAAAERVAAAVREHGVRGVALACDVSDPAAVESLAAASFAELGAIHLLCNNAGVLLQRDLVDASDADWHWMIGVNLLGVVHGVRAFVPRMRSHGDPAHIVNTASLLGWLPTPGLGLYDATKAAVISISEALRDELAPDGIGVSVLCPGTVATRIAEAGRNRPEHLGGHAAAPDIQPPPEDERPPSPPGIEVARTPAEVAETVLAGVRAGELYIPSHPTWKDAIAGRFESILDSFDTVAARVRATAPDA